MAGGETITEHHGTTTTSKWYSSILTPQTVLLICAGFVSAVIFWKDSKDNWIKVKQLEEKLAVKADDNDLKSLSERVNRQYETNNKILDRIIELEKKQEYDRGRSDEDREVKRQQRFDKLNRANN